MSDHLRSDDLLDHERDLVASWRAQRAPAAAKERAMALVTVAAAAGLAAQAGVTAKAAKAAATLASAKGSGTAAITGTLVAKWAATGALMGTLFVGASMGASAVHERISHPEERSAGPRSSPPAKAASPGVATGPGAASTTDVPAEPPLASTTTTDESATRASAPAPKDVSAPRAGSDVHTTAKSAPIPSPREDAPAAGAKSIGADLASVEKGRALLEGGDAAEALKTFATIDAASPLYLEAEALRVDALEHAGRHEEARAHADAFLARYPSSPYAARVRRVLQSEKGSRQ